MRLPKDLLTNTYRRPNVYLCEVDKTKICMLETTNLKGSFKFNAYSELTFTVARTYTNMVTGETQVNPFYDRIEALRLIYLENFGYFEIQEPEISSDGLQEVKNITAYSLEYRLSQRYLENFNINTGEVDSLEVIEAAGSRIIPITLVNTVNRDLSLTDLVLERVYDWTWGHIDPSLTTMSRQFEISRASVYDFIVQDICEKFNCYAVFDTINNKINLYAEALVTKHIGDGKTTKFEVSSPYDSIDTVTVDSYKTTKYTYCIEEDEYTEEKTGYITFDTPPANGAKIEITDGSQTKWQTDVYVAFENLAQEVNISHSAEDIKTVLTVKGQDDLDIREVNMGLPYIVDLSYYYTVDWMGQDLYDAYTTYLQTSNASQSKYSENSKRMLEITGYITYETQRLSLQYSIADNVTSTTVGTYYVRGGVAPDYYYREVKLPDEYNANIEHYYMLSGSDLDEDKFANLYSAIQTYFVSEDNRDVSEIEKLIESFQFVEKYTLESLISDLSDATSLNEKKSAILAFFDEVWDQLGQTPLDSLYLQPYKKIEATNTEAGWNETSNDNYWRYYPVTLVIESLEKEIEDRTTVIDRYKEQYNALSTENNQIANSTSIYNNFTHEQLVRLSPFLREDEYTDDNFLETDSDTIDMLMKTKQELLECGRIELAKLCEPKLAFSMDMANIYALPEFEPIIEQFQLGNLINVAIRPDYIKKARLLAVDINFDDFSDFSCEFGELTSLKTQSSIHADLLANALTAGNSVASSQSYWEKGADLATSTDLKIQSGLLNAIDGIYSADKSVLIDNHGILLRKVEEDGSFSPYQIWLTNNNILVSTDAFETAQTGIGVFEVDGHELYGVLAKAVLAGYIESSTIIGGTLDIGNGTFTVDADGNMVSTSGKIAGWNITTSYIDSTVPNSKQRLYLASASDSSGYWMRTFDENENATFSLTKEGKLIAKGADIAGHITATSLTLGSGVTIPASKLSGMDVYIAKDGTVGSTPSDGSTGFKVSSNGLLTASNAIIYGTIYASEGKIAGWNITDSYIDSTVSDSKQRLYLASANDSSMYWMRTFDKDENATFSLTKEGQLVAKGVDVEGKITASSGTIGSWSIGDMDNYTESIYTTYCAASTPSSSNPEYAVFMRGKGEATTIAIGVKKRTSSSTSWNDADNPFYVRKDGYVKMENAHVTGTINSSSGKIGGFVINNERLICREDNTNTDASLAYMALNAYDYDASNHNAIIIGTRSSASDDYTTQFRVRYDGSVYMRNATITGDSTISAACIPNLSADIITSGTFDAVRIPNLSADKITAGTLDVDRIPNLSAGKITSGTISTSRLDASVITTGNFESKSLGTGNLTIRSGCVIGSATYNATIGIRDGYVYISAAGPTSYGTTIHEIVRQAVENGSNRNIKTDIHGFDDRYDRFFDCLNPQLYRYNFDENSGYSMGYIWQETEEALVNAGLTKNDVGAVYESAAVTGGLGLRKTDFISLNTWQIQKLKNRITELENRLEALERNDTK